MENINKYNLTIINILFLMFPLSIILGNLFINLNIVFLCFFALIFYRKKIIKFEINLLDKIILIFFLYTFLTLILNFLGNYFDDQKFPEFIVYKTLFFSRYLALYLVLRFLLAEKILILKWFSFACALCACFVSLDILIQFSFGKNFLGFEPISARHYSGVFGEELVAGGYLQKFSLFVIFLPLILKQTIYKKISIQVLIFLIFSFVIILSGNRMPLILFILSFFTYFFLDKNLRKYLIATIAVTLLFLALNLSINQKFKYTSAVFFLNAKTLATSFFSEDVKKLPMGIWYNPYVTEFTCFKIVWKKNPYFGGGIKSYRATKGCTTHPHNYYFEILTDLGLVGLILIMSFLLVLMKKIFMPRSNLFKLDLNSLNAKYMPFLLVLFIEFFPVRTSGSFFSTGNASIIFLMLAIIVSIISQRKT
jgi:O-antigen ligase